MLHQQEKDEHGVKRTTNRIFCADGLHVNLRLLSFQAAWTESISCLISTRFQHILHVYHEY